MTNKLIRPQGDIVNFMSNLEQQGISFHRVPVLTKDSIDRYFASNVKPHLGTSYGEVEKKHWAELKEAAMFGDELISVPEQYAGIQA